MLLITDGRVLTRDPDHPYYERGAVAIEGGEIREVGPAAELEARYPGAERLGARGGLVMPGLINCHTHMYSALARGLSIPGNHPRTFLQVLEGTWWAIDRRLDLDAVRACALVTVLDSVRCGVTTLFDHHAGFGSIEGSLFRIYDACRELGVRACLCYEVSDRDGVAKRDASIRENAEFARWCARHRDETGDRKVCALFGGHAPFTLSDETLAKMAEANDGLTGFHIHVSEGMDDVWAARREHGTTPVERLLRAGLLGPRTVLGHCVHVGPDEIAMIAESGAAVVNNPQSNMGNAVGCAPVPAMRAAGVRVGMGTDAFTPDVLEGLRAYLCAQRAAACLPNVGFEGCQMLFGTNAELASEHFGTRLGVLAPGAAADVAVFDYDPPTPFSAANADGHLMFGLSGRDCRAVVCDGEVLYRDGAFVKTDAARAYAWAREQAVRLWSALGA